MKSPSLFEGTGGQSDVTKTSPSPGLAQFLPDRIGDVRPPSVTDFPVHEPEHCFQSVQQRYLGVRLHDCLVIEVFAGSANLCKACRKAGLQSLAVDRFAAGTSVAAYDLTADEDIAGLVQVITAENQG